jgi:octaprenyl-diphosphate synthase
MRPSGIEGKERVERVNRRTTSVEEHAQSFSTVQEVAELCADDMRRVNECIRDSLDSHVVLINQVANYIIAGGGKRLRPMLLVLAARACGYTGENHVPLASIIEFIHTATLLHDDVVDESDTRRGQRSAHAVWGNAATVLVGDFLYSRSFQMMVALDSMRIMDILADTTNTISEGEVQQLLNMGDPEISEQRYLEVIENKTAKLFEAACRLGAVLAGQDQSVESALARFGRHLGCAFQVADDVMDYDGDGDTMGKNIGDDLAEGKPTLPLIHARAAADEAGRQVLDQAIRNGGIADLEKVRAILGQTGALESAMEHARTQAARALEALQALPPTPWREALSFLAGYSVNRSH